MRCRRPARWDASPYRAKWGGGRAEKEPGVRAAERRLHINLSPCFHVGASAVGRRRDDELSLARAGEADANRPLDKSRKGDDHSRHEHLIYIP